MADQAQEAKPNPWVAVIDKLTDPLECLITKICSARFVVAVFVTVVGSLITYKLCAYFSTENKELVMFATGQFFIIWNNIIKDYFNRSDRGTSNKG